MSDMHKNEPLLDMFLFETGQLLELLEQTILTSEKEGGFSESAINEIFRHMHTIKGSASMMMFSNIALLAHSIEDLFFYIRKEKPEQIDCSALSDLIFEGVDFIKIEVEKIKNNAPADGNAEKLIEVIKEYLTILKQENSTEPLAAVQEEKIEKAYIQSDIETSYKYNLFKAVIRFEDGCELENIRAFTVINTLKEFANSLHYIPNDIIDNDESIDVIRRDGFCIYLKADRTYEDLQAFFLQTPFLKDMELQQLEDDMDLKQFSKGSELKSKENLLIIPPTNEVLKTEKERTVRVEQVEKDISAGSQSQSIISVNVIKLDKLMDLVGEMVIAEAMVIQNPDLNGLSLDNFRKASRQLNKITTEIQDMVMSIRMVPLSTTFTKMHRIVRDMCKKLDKEVHLDIIGEETEVDKNIIEHISDPLMHLVRNCIDHGIESVQERQEQGKDKAGTVTLEAKNVGSDVLIIVRDDGKGLNKEKILKKARENDLITKNEEDMTDKEIYSLILLPGFSTKEKVTEFSGRGVGMDVVSRNIEAVGGTLSVDSITGKGTTITLKIPLTLAIIDGMNIKVGNSRYTIPTIAIKESFRPREEDIIRDPEGNEMIMVRGQCYQIRRLHELYRVKTNITNLWEGIILMIEQDDKTVCVFADELLGQQQVVVKALPQYIQEFKRMKGLAGCTLLGDGSISLILDVSRLVNQ